MCIDHRSDLCAKLTRSSIALACATVVALALGAGQVRATDYPEVEPNETKALATIPGAALVPGDSLVGNTTGATTTSGAATSVDTFLIQTGPLPLGVYRHRLVITSATVGHTGTIRATNQVAAAADTLPGIPWNGTVGTIGGTADNTGQTSVATSTPPRYNQWYGFGKQEQLYYRVAGVAATTANYFATLETVEITPTDIGIFREGLITINMTGQGHTTDTDFWVYDDQLNAITGYGNDDASATLGGAPIATTSLQSWLARTYAPGTYYIAVSNFSFTNNQPAASDDNFRSASIADFPNIALNSSSTTNVNIAFTITDSVGAVPVPNTKVSQFDVNWFKFTVEPLPTNGACCTGDACNIVEEGTCTGEYYGNGSVCGANTCVAACCHDNICEDKNLADCTALSGVWNQNQACAPGGSFFCPPPNDNCASVTPVVLTANVPHTFTGDNRGSTNDCAAFAGGQVWEAFTLPNTCGNWNVKLDYCTTAPAFANAWLNLATTCPCSVNTAAGVFNTTECGDGNVTIRWSLPPGTYYYPVLMSSTAPVAYGPYTINVVAECGYCASSATSTIDTNIEQFTLNTINQVNPATGWCDTYNDFTASSTTLQAGLTYPFTLVIGDCEGASCFSKRAAIFVDANNDFVFDPINERLYNSGQLGATPCPVMTLNGNITIPLASVLGPTRLRVVVFESTSTDPSPCGTYSWGATEDFTVNIIAPSEEGACCAPNGTCSVTIEANCLEPSTFSGLGTDCSNPDLCKGKCCHPDGTCTLEGPANCLEPSTFGGIGTDCSDPDQCKGKCCQSDGTCTLEGPANCVAPDIFGGLGTNCTGAICTGRCCLADGTCSVGSLDDCNTLGGIFNLALDCNATTVTTFAGVNLAVLDSPAAAVTNVQTLVGQPTPIADVDVDLNMTHTWVGDLVITIEHNNTIVTLIDRMGVPASGAGCLNDNLQDIIMDDEGTVVIETTCNAGPAAGPSPPNFYPGTAIGTPYSALGLSAFDGMDPNGPWTISVQDFAGGDTGTLLSWSLHINTNAPVCPVTETIVDCSAGDMNRDGELDGLDTQTFVDVAVGLNTDPQAVCDADVDWDGDVDAADALALVDRELAKDDYTITAPAAPGCDGSSVSVTIAPAVNAAKLLFVRNKGGVGDCDVKAQAYNAANVALGPVGGWRIKPKGARSLPVGTVRVDYNCPTGGTACNCVVGP